MVVRDDQDKVARGTPKGGTFGKRCWVIPEGSTGIKDPGTRRQLHLKIEWTSDGYDRKAFRLEFMK
jgi:hypothetical protein